jgi:hypothetical protein
MTIETRTDHDHRPTAEFRDYMDWELQRAFGRDRLHRRLRLAAIIVASLGVGVTAGLAPAQVRQDSARESLLQAAEADLRLAQVRMSIARERFITEDKLVAMGAVSSSADAAAQVRESEAQVARIQAEMEEIRLTGQSPRNELNAPQVNGRDFVSQRINLQLSVAEARLRAAEQKLLELRRRVRAGVVTQVHELEALTDLLRARRDFTVLAEKRALRREFLEKQTPVDQLALRLERTEMQQDHDVAEAQVRLARQRLSTIQKQRAAGAIGELEVMRADLDLRERELEVARLGMRLRAIPKIQPIQPIKPPGKDTLR